LYLRHDALHFLLEGFDLVPSLESLTHDTKVKVFHENGILIHFQENVARDFLPFEDITMAGIYSEFTQMLGRLGGIPSADLLYCRVRILFLVRLVAVDVGDTMAQMTAVFTSRVIDRLSLLR
jgi:hypothetical protein